MLTFSLSEHQMPSVPALDGNEKPKKKKKSGDNPDESLTAHQRELAQDESIDPTPFRFKPYQLAHMLDPKNLQALVAFGGVDGIIHGLGTNAEHGLTTRGDVSHKHSSENAMHPGELSEKVPNITLTEPSGRESSPTGGDDDIPLTATMDDRRRVYGENILPTRISKTLLQLMADAMKDKVLVCICLLACHSALIR